MATIIIPRPVITRPSYSNYTTGSDYIRGSGASEVLGYSLSSNEQSFISQYQTFFNVDANDARDFFFFGGGPQFGGPAPNYSRFLGDDRIYGRGGDDYVVDFFGNNYVVTEEGNDRILLGNGNDRIYDQGGDNDIDILGGNNTVTTGDGSDSINTGDGVDNINAFDGTNFIDAGEGNNIVRGGDEFDEIRVGTGDDFVDVRGGFLGDQDLNGDGIADTGFDKNFDGVIDPPDVAQIEFFDPFFSSPEEPLISGLFHNLVVDNGGSDNIRSTAPGSRQGDDFILSDVIVDTTVVNGVTQLVVSNVVNVGEDVIEVGGGNNFILDAGGDTTVRTLDGNDTIFTSYYAAATGVAGNDDINSGAGADFVNPGDGSDTVRGGAGPDQIELEFDGAIDTLTYGPGDVNLADFDQVAGFDGNGIDKFDLSALGATLPDLLLTTAFGPLLVGIDQNANDVFEAGVDIPVAFLLSVDGPLTLDNFIFDDPSIA